MNSFSKFFKAILDYIFDRPTPVQLAVTAPAHVEAPTTGGSPDWIQPPAGNTMQDWFKYFSLPYNNQQEVLPNYRGDIMQDNCAVQAPIEQIQAILNYYYKNNLFPAPVMDFLRENYLNAQGWIKLSVRYSSVTAKVKNGIGANIGDVYDQFSVNGIIPEHLYPEPVGEYTWEQYMAPIDPKILAFGQKSTTFFKILWSVIPGGNGWSIPNLEPLRQALISSPVVIAGAIGNVDRFGIEQYAGQQIYQHCRVIGAIQGNNPKVLDNYPLNGTNANPSAADLTRTFSQNFPIPCAIKAQVKII